MPASFLRLANARKSRPMLVRQSTTVPKVSKVNALIPRMDYYSTTSGEEENMSRIVLAAALAVLCAHAAPAAETWPARPVRLIVPFPPGGSNDIVARLVGNHLTERLG